MAITTGEFIKRLGKKAGIDFASDPFKDLNFEEFKGELPDEVVAGIDNKLLTIDAAKNNSDVNKALRQQILGAADSKMDELLKEIKVQPGDDFLTEKNTYEKLGIFSKMLFDAGQKKAAADNNAGVHETLKKEKEAFAQKENEYKSKFGEFQNQLKAAQEERTKIEQEFQKSRAADRNNYDIYKKLFGKNYNLPKEMDNDLKVETANVVINKELTKNGFVIGRDDKGKLSLFDSEGNPAYSANHNLLNLDEFIDAALAENKMLKINNDAEPPATGQRQQTAANTIQNPQNQNNGNQAIVQEIDNQIAEFAKMT